MAVRCGYCPALSVRDGPAHSLSCPRYKPPAPRKPAGHNVVWKKDLPYFEGGSVTTGNKGWSKKDGWYCKRCHSTWFDCTKPRPRDEPVCHMVIVEEVMES